MAPSLKSSILLAASVACLFAPTDGFIVHFWAGPKCTSALDGTYGHLYTSKGTCYSIPINVQSATIQKEAKDKDTESKSRV